MIDPISQVLSKTPTTLQNAVTTTWHLLFTWLPNSRWIYTYFEHLSKVGLEERLDYLLKNVAKTGQKFVNLMMNVWSWNYP